MTTTGTTLRHHPVAYDPPLADRERWSPARTEYRHRQLELRDRLPGHAVVESFMVRTAVASGSSLGIMRFSA
jgi:hypothetical protein